MPLPSYHKRIFQCCQGQALRARKRDLDRDRIPAFSKAGIQAIPLPATAAAPLSPRRPPPPMRVGYADHAGVAGRRGYAPATQARCDEEEGLHTKRSLQEGKGKTDALTLLSQAYFSECCQVKPFGRASATLTEIEYPLLVKRVFKPSPPRHRGYAAKPPTATAADASRLCRPRRRRRPSGLRARYAGALRRGEEGLHTKRSLQEGKGKTDALTLLSQAYFRSAVKVKPFGRASATLTEIEYPLLVKRVFKPSPPRHRGYAAKPPTATAADASRLCRPRRRRRPSGLRARYAGALRRGGGTSHQTQSPRG